MKNLIFICLIANNTNLNMKSVFFVLNSSTFKDLFRKIRTISLVTLILFLYDFL